MVIGSGKDVCPEEAVMGRSQGDRSNHASYKKQEIW